jgi:hypothetical protein
VKGAWGYRQWSKQPVDTGRTLSLTSFRTRGQRVPLGLPGVLRVYLPTSIYISISTYLLCLPVSSIYPSLSIYLLYLPIAIYLSPISTNLLYLPIYIYQSPSTYLLSTLSTHLPYLPLSTYPSPISTYLPTTRFPLGLPGCRAVVQPGVGGPSRRLRHKVPFETTGCRATGLSGCRIIVLPGVGGSSRRERRERGESVGGVASGRVRGPASRLCHVRESPFGTQGSGVRKSLPVCHVRESPPVCHVRESPPVCHVRESPCRCEAYLPRLCHVRESPPV